jgi:hypothetical protein
MPTAYILANTEIGSEKHVFETLKKNQPCGRNS